MLNPKKEHTFHLCYKCIRINSYSAIHNGRYLFIAIDFLSVTTASVTTAQWDPKALCRARPRPVPMGNSLLNWLSSATRFRPATERGFCPDGVTCIVRWANTPAPVNWHRCVSARPCYKYLGKIIKCIYYTGHGISI